MDVPIRDCLVSFDGARGVRHSTTVQASSVLEAAGLGLKRVREQEMLDSDAGFGDITVEICTKTVHFTNYDSGVTPTAQPRARCRERRIRGS